MNYLHLQDDVRLAYRVDGTDDTPALLLLNSLGTDVRLWDAQVVVLAPYFRVVRYDTRGHGQSSIPTTPATIEQLGQDALALLNHLDIEQAHLCGVSLGGLTALWLAANCPHRIERAVFANTAARIGSAEGWSARIDAVQAGGMAAIREDVVARFLSVPFRIACPDATHFVGDMLAATDPHGYSAACAALRDADMREVVASIRAPSLIITGALDEATPPAQSEELHAAIEHSQLVVLPQTGHLSNIEQPDVFNACVLKFLGVRG